MQAPVSFVATPLLDGASGSARNLEQRHHYASGTSSRSGRQADFHAEEAAAYEKKVVERNNVDHRGTNTEADVASAYNQFWYDRGTKAVGTRRTSLIVDPPDGHIPALTPEAQKRVDEKRAWMRGARYRRSGGPLARRTLYSVGHGRAAHAARPIQQ